jgi:hypothetical protein
MNLVLSFHICVAHCLSNTRVRQDGTISMEEIMMTALERGLRIKLSMWDAVAAPCERLYCWRLTRTFVEYLAVKIAKRNTLAEIRKLTNAPLRKEEDAAHLTFLLESLVILEKVEAGKMSFEEFKRTGEIESPERDQAWARLMVRLEEIRPSK